ncbi:hypothetical protein EVAR_4982_1 [Eumeta japonica]|uniref:Uncharacterized protein n=1 Tax=Eumeta variegata TaxID=151549 RepID=A0A4C1V114_EUMVA|nr:hypothetical protein EVAR_4982_1 [Eumeta japonica]
MEEKKAAAPRNVQVVFYGAERAESSSCEGRARPAPPAPPPSRRARRIVTRAHFTRSYDTPPPTKRRPLVEPSFCCACDAIPPRGQRTARYDLSKFARSAVLVTSLGGRKSC